MRRRLEVPAAGEWVLGETQGEEEPCPARREQMLLGVGRGDGVGHSPWTPNATPSADVFRLCDPRQVHTTSLCSLCSPEAVTLAQVQHWICPTVVITSHRQIGGWSRGVGTGISDKSPGPGSTQVCRWGRASGSLGHILPQGGGQWNFSDLPTGLSV